MLLFLIHKNITVFKLLFISLILSIIRGLKGMERAIKG